MNEFDQHIKHKLKIKYYIRYADDFVIFSDDRVWLGKLIPEIFHFLDSRLKLTLHPNKVSISTLASGVDFLGWVHFYEHRVLRTAAKRRMLRNIKAKPCNPAVAQSYLGLLGWGNACKLAQML